MSYFIANANAESSGGKNLYNAASGASGKHQFLQSTWRDLMARRPELGLTANGIMDDKQQDRAVRAFTDENRSLLTKTLGPDLTDADLYGAHHFGATGYTKIRKAAPGTPIESVLSPAAITANPYLKGKTVDQVQSIIAKKIGAGIPLSPEEELQANLANEASQGQPPVPEMNVGALSYPMQSHVGQGSAMAPQDPSYMAQAMAGVTGNRRDAVPGAVAPQRDTSAYQSDALLRFGAGMLSGKTLSEGMARGFQGVAEAGENAQAVDLKQQAIAEQRAQYAQARQPKSQMGELFYSGRDNTPYREIFQTDGSVKYLNMTSGKLENNLPDKTIRAVDSALKSQTKNLSEMENSMYDDASTASSNLAGYQTLRTALNGVQTGGDLVSSFGRGLASATGLNIAGNDPAAIDLANTEFAKLELKASEAMKGQGQITESERAILKNSVGNIRTNPKALEAILGVLEAAENRKISMADAWDAAPPEVKANGIRSFQRSFSKENPKPSVTMSPTGGYQVTPQDLDLLNKYK